MFRPFAPFAAVFCGRNRFTAGIGQVISVWVMVMIVTAADLVWNEIDIRMKPGAFELWFCWFNRLGFVISMFALLRLLWCLIDGARAQERDGHRLFGVSRRWFNWVPLCCCARNEQELHAHYEPYACFAIGLLVLLAGGLFGLTLLVGSVALAVYEAAEEKRLAESSKETLTALRAKISATESILEI